MKYFIPITMIGFTYLGRLVHRKTVCLFSIKSKQNNYNKMVNVLFLNSYLSTTWRLVIYTCCKIMCVKEYGLSIILFLNFLIIRVFHKWDEIGNKPNISIRGFTMWKKFSDKMLPPVGIEPRSLITSDSKSNTILSTLTWHMLLRRSLNFCSYTTWYVDLDDLRGINRAWLYQEP